MPRELTIAERLFEVYYPCRVPRAFGLSYMERQYVGAPTTGKAKLDAEQAIEWTARQHSAGEMANLWAEGSRIELTRPEDAIPIYNAIMDYLIDIRRKADLPFHTNAVNEEAVRKFDDFATYIFDIVRTVDATYHRKGKGRPTLEGMVKRRAIRNRRYVEAAKAATEHDKEGNVVLKKHEPMAEGIIHSVTTKRVYRKE